MKGPVCLGKLIRRGFRRISYFMALSALRGRHAGPGQCSYQEPSTGPVPEWVPVKVCGTTKGFPSRLRPE